MSLHGDELADRLHEVKGTNPEQLVALRELGSDGDGSYRSKNIPRERLWALVQDEDIAPETRARAATALLGFLVSGDRERLRIA